MRDRTLHIFTEYRHTSKIDAYWLECFHDSDFHEFNVNIIDGTYFPTDSYLLSDAWFKSVQLRNLIDMMQRKIVKDGDVFIFCNAWNFVAVPLSYFRDEFGLNIHIIGIWGDSLYNQNSNIWRRFKGLRKKYGRQFEASLFHAYDGNVFLCDEHWKMFQAKYQINGRSRKASRQKYFVTGYPFEYLAKEAEVSKKNNVVVFPYDLTLDIQRDVFHSMANDMPEYDFV